MYLTLSAHISPGHLQYRTVSSYAADAPEARSNHTQLKLLLIDGVIQSIHKVIHIDIIIIYYNSLVRLH